MACQKKKTNAKGSGAHIQGPEHHLPISSQYRRGGPTVKGLKGCGLLVGGKGIYFKVPIEVSFGENALLDHLMQAIEVGREKAFLIHSDNARRVKGKNKNKEALS